MEKNYLKDFESWNPSKQSLNQRSQFRPYKEMDIWWASLGVNVGYEIDGKNRLFERPVLVIKKINRQTAYVVPLTSSLNAKNKNLISYDAKGVRKSANIAQARMIDVRRFQRRIDFRITVSDFQNILEKFKEQF